MGERKWSELYAGMICRADELQNAAIREVRKAMEEHEAKHLLLTSQIDGLIGELRGSQDAGRRVAERLDKHEAGHASPVNITYTGGGEAEEYLLLKKANERLMRERDQWREAAIELRDADNCFDCWQTVWEQARNDTCKQGAAARIVRALDAIDALEMGKSPEAEGYSAEGERIAVDVAIPPLKARIAQLEAANDNLQDLCDNLATNGGKARGEAAGLRGRIEELESILNGEATPEMVDTGVRAIRDGNSAETWEEAVAAIWRAMCAAAKGGNG